LNETYGRFPRRYREGIFSAISAGFFFLFVGAIFVKTPDLFQHTLDFLSSFGLEKVPNTGIYFIAPEQPLAQAHQVVYQAAEQFSYAIGFLQIVILALRFFAGSPWNKKAETVSNLVFWIGAGYLTRMLLIEHTIWFVFWSAIIMLLGVSLIVRAIILGAVSTMRTA